MDPAVFGYIRVSQAEGASGLATQSRILTDHGLRDDRIFTDVASGRTMRHPAWTTLRETLQPGDAVVVPRLDRLARNLSEGLRTIEELHAQADAGGPTGQVMRHHQTYTPGMTSIFGYIRTSRRLREGITGMDPASQELQLLRVGVPIHTPTEKTVRNTLSR